MAKMAEARPDPDQLLERIKAEEARARRGQLRIFFGASAGVGKTYAMLEAARSVRAAGTDVVVGYVEPHGRVETERLLEGLPRLPTLAVRYREHRAPGVRSGCGARAATRASCWWMSWRIPTSTAATPAPRHPKRWQDVEELLAAGINVWTTVNVQHLESLNDLIFQTTGVRQRETLPDHVFDEADEIELIDLPPDDLHRAPARRQGVRAASRPAPRSSVSSASTTSWRCARSPCAGSPTGSRPPRARCRPRTFAARIAGDRVLVAVGPDEQAEQLVRAGKRLADALRCALDRRVRGDARRCCDFRSCSATAASRCCDWPSPSARETVTLDGPSAAATPRRSTRAMRHATRVIVGAPKRHGWRAWLRPSTATELMRRARGFDLLLIAASGQRAARGAPAAAAVRQHGGRAPRTATSGPWPSSLLATVLAFAHVSALRAVQPGDDLPAGRDRGRACGSGADPPR